MGVAVLIFMICMVASLLVMVGAWKGFEETNEGEKDRSEKFEYL